MNSPFSTSRLTVAIALILFVLAPPVSAAGGKGKGKAAVVENPEAREARERGIVALNLGRYDEAAKDLEKAYELSRDPNILFSLVTAYRLAGKPDQALALCASFLRSTDSLTARNRPQIERTVAELEIIVEEMRLKSPAARKQPVAVPSAQEVEPPAIGETEPAAAVEPPPQSESKEHFVAAAAVVVPPSSDSNTNLLGAQVPPPAPTKHRPFYRSPWLWTAVGVVVAVGAGFLIYYEATHSPGAPATTWGAQRMF